MFDPIPPTLSGVNPLELVDIVAHIIPLLDFDSLVVVNRVSRLWHQLVQAQLVPQSVVHWDESLPEDKLMTMAAELDKTRVLTINSKFYPGKALWSFPQREARKALYAPMLMAMGDPAKNGLLEEIVFRGGMDAEEDLFPVLPNISYLKRLTIEPDREKGYADRAGLLKILGTRPGGPGDSLQELTIRYARWHMTGNPYKPNMARCRLKRLVLDRVDMMDNNVMTVLQCFPELEELVAIQVLKRWAIPVMKSMSISCPRLKRLTFRNDVPWNVSQMGWLTRYLVPDLEALTIHGYDGDALGEMLDMLGSRFPQLQRLELYQCLGASTPKELGFELVKYLAGPGSQLQHLRVPDAVLSLSHLVEDGRLLASRDLRTLEIGFDATHIPGETEKHVAEFLAEQWPKVRYLALALPRLLNPAQDLRALKRLKDLVRVRLLVYELGPLVAAKEDLKTFVFGKPGVWPLLSRFEILYRDSQEEPASTRELGEWLQQETRPLVTFVFKQRMDNEPDIF